MQSHYPGSRFQIGLHCVVVQRNGSAKMASNHLTQTIWSLLVGVSILNVIGVVCSADVDETHQHTFVELKSGVSVPLIGFGIGNLPHEQIFDVVHAQLQGGSVQLIDTAHASHNEKILADAIADFDNAKGEHSHTRGGGSSDDPEDLPPIHVVTKVWYTYLGHKRTKISVEESLNELQVASNTRQVYVHMLLHWPRCNDDVSWMNCEREENELPKHVKEAGPPPHLNKENAFLESWIALEVGVSSMFTSWFPFIANLTLCFCMSL